MEYSAESFSMDVLPTAINMLLADDILNDLQSDPSNAMNECTWFYCNFNKCGETNLTEEQYTFYKNRLSHCPEVFDCTHCQ